MIKNIMSKSPKTYKTAKSARAAETRATLSPYRTELEGVDYRDLQKQASALGLKASGARKDLVSRLARNAAGISLDSDYKSATSPKKSPAKSPSRKSVKSPSRKVAKSPGRKAGKKPTTPRKPKTTKKEKEPMVADEYITALLTGRPLPPRTPRKPKRVVSAPSGLMGSRGSSPAGSRGSSPAGSRGASPTRLLAPSVARTGSATRAVPLVRGSPTTQFVVPAAAPAIPPKRLPGKRR